MPGKPMLMRHIDSIRESLDLDASDRAKLVLTLGERGLSLDLGCLACGDLLEWVASKQQWQCPECDQETTDQEAAAFVKACYEALGAVLNVADEGKVRRWLRERMGI